MISPRQFWRFALAALTILPFAAAAQPAPGSEGLSFQGARLGMTREAWGALPPPGGASPRTEVVCAQDLGKAPGEGRTAGSVVCTYVVRYGRFTLPATARLADGRRAKGLRYIFIADRLTQIEYRVSVDDYEGQMARFKALYGAPTRVRRDEVRTPDGALPRVTQTWTLPDGTVELVDPVAPFSDLRVRLSAAGAVLPPSANNDTLPRQPLDRDTI
jgi:hypothetical protein